MFLGPVDLELGLKAVLIPGCATVFLVAVLPCAAAGPTPATDEFEGATDAESRPLATGATPRQYETSFGMRDRAPDGISMSGLGFMTSLL